MWSEYSVLQMLINWNDHIIFLDLSDTNLSIRFQNDNVLITYLNINNKKASNELIQYLTRESTIQFDDFIALCIWMMNFLQCLHCDCEMETNTFSIYNPYIKHIESWDHLPSPKSQKKKKTPPTKYKWCSNTINDITTGVNARSVNIVWFFDYWTVKP